MGRSPETTLAQPPVGVSDEPSLGRRNRNRIARPGRFRRWTVDISTLAAFSVAAPGLAHAPTPKAAVVEETQGTRLESAIQTQAQDRATSNNTTGRALSPSSLPDAIKTTLTIVIHPGDNGWTLAKKEVKKAGFKTTIPTTNAFDHILNGQVKGGDSTLNSGKKIEAFSDPVNEALVKIMETPLPQNTPAVIKTEQAKLRATNTYNAGTTFKQTVGADRQLVATTENLINKAQDQTSPVAEALRGIGINTVELGTSQPSPNSSSVTQPPPENSSTPGTGTILPPPSSEATSPSQTQIQQEINHVAQKAGTQGFKKGLETGVEGAIVVGALATTGLLLARRRRRKEEQERQRQEAEMLRKERQLRNLIDNTRYAPDPLVAAQNKGLLEILPTNELHLEDAVQLQLDKFNGRNSSQPLTELDIALIAVNRRLFQVQRDRDIFEKPGTKQLITTSQKVNEALRELIEKRPADLQNTINQITDSTMLLKDPYIRTNDNQQAIDHLLEQAGITISKRENSQSKPLISSASHTPSSAQPSAESKHGASPRRKKILKIWTIDQLKRLRPHRHR